MCNARVQRTERTSERASRTQHSPVVIRIIIVIALIKHTEMWIKLREIWITIRKRFRSLIATAAPANMKICGVYWSICCLAARNKLFNFARTKYYCNYPEFDVASASASARYCALWLHTNAPHTLIHRLLFNFFFFFNFHMNQKLCENIVV